MPNAAKIQDLRASLRGQLIEPTDPAYEEARALYNGMIDDITGRGQCRAALKDCPNIPTDRKDHFECPGVGHYGVFNGSRFTAQIVPRMAAFMRAHAPRRASCRAGGGIVMPHKNERKLPQQACVRP